MNIFITGASGFVGGAATRRLVADGHRIRAMSRSSSSDQKIRALGAEPVRSDLDTVIAADVRGAEIVIHCAAFVEQWGPLDVWDRINVLGTRRMLAAAIQAAAHYGSDALRRGLAFVHDSGVRLAGADYQRGHRPIQ